MGLVLVPKAKNLYLDHVREFTSADQWIPSPAAAMTMTNQKTLDTMRLAPFSRMY